MSTETKQNLLTNLLTIGELSRLTGVRISTLRTWSDRYCLLDPVRSKGGFRLYSREDVAKAMSLKQALLVNRIPPAVFNPHELDSTSFPHAILAHPPMDSPTALGALTAVPQSSNYPSQPIGGRIRALFHMTAAVARAQDGERVIEQVLAAACHLFDGEGAGLLMPNADSDDDAALRKYSWGTMSSALNDVDESIYTRMEQSAGPLLVPNTALGGQIGRCEEHGWGALIAMPLHHTGVLRGVLYVVNSTSRPFSGDDGVLSATLANIAACVIENASLVKQTRIARQKHQAMLDADRDLMLLVDARGHVSFAGGGARRLLGFDPGELLGRSFRDLLAPTSANRGFWGSDEAGDSNSTRDVELVAKDGRLVIAEARRLDMVDLGPEETIRWVVRDCSAARRAEIALIKRDQHLSIISKLASALSQTLDLDMVLQVAVNTVVKTTGHGPALIALVDEASRQLVVRSHCNAPEALVEDLKYIRLGEGITGRVAVTGDPICVRDIATDDRSTSAVPYARHHKHRSFACVPLKLTSQVIGTMTIISKRFYAFNDDDVQLFVAIGYLVGSAIERARLHEATVKGYYDRLILMSDELRLMTFVRNQERQRIAYDLRHYILGRIERGKASPKDLNRALAALTALESEIGAPMDDANLPALLEKAVRWRGTFDPNGSGLRLVWHSWPDQVPNEVTWQLHSLVMRVLLKARQAAPRVGIVLDLHHDDQSVSVQFKQQYSTNRPDSAADISAIIWDKLDLTDLVSSLKTMGGWLKVESINGNPSLVVTVPRNWDQAPRHKAIMALVVNEQPLYAQAVANLLDSQKAVQVVGVAQSPQEAVHMARKLSPDVVIVDVSPPGVHGIDVTRALRSALPEARILILTPEQGPSVVEGLLAGATGFAFKTSSPSDLLRAISLLMRSEPTMTLEVQQRTLALLLPTKPNRGGLAQGHPLTTRELDILRLIAAGKNSKEACRLMGITDKTVRRHISNMYQKLQVFDRTQLVLYAARKGLVELSEQGGGDLLNPQPAEPV